MSLSCGLLVIYNTIDYQVQRILTSKHALIDQVKLLEDKYLLTAGLDPKIRIWNLDNDKQVSKF